MNPQIITETNPLLQFRKWFVAQPDDVRQTIAFQLCVKMPVEDTGLDVLMRPEETFLEYIDSCSGRPNDVLSDVLLIRALMEFVIVRHYGTPDEWESKRERREEIAKILEAEHGPNPMCDKLRKEDPKHEAVFLASIQSWRALRNSALSDEFLEAWEASQPSNIP